MNFAHKSLNSLVKLQQTLRIAEIELGMENTIGITLETGVGVQNAILHVCQKVCLSIFFQQKIFLSTMFDFHFRENPCFHDEIGKYQNKLII